jgi:ADP-heptose:LPS heptosyltransferase
MPGFKPSYDTHFINRFEASMLIPKLEKQLETDANNWRVMINLGNSYYTMGNTEECIRLFKKAYDLAPNSAVVCSNLGVALGDHVRFDEAFPYIEKSNKLDPNDQYAASVYAEFLLREGQWRMGWDLYERCRFSIPKCPLPRYVGGPLQGARVLVLQEGGSGDQFMFFRFFENLKALQPEKITFACDHRLHCIFEDHPWVDALLADHDTKIELKDYDCHVSSFSLGAIFAPTLTDLKFRTPYLAGERTVPRIIGTPLKVGLCWKAGEAVETRLHRCLSKENVKKLIENQNVRWFSLQYGENAPAGMETINLSTWEHTAEAIDLLDLVISVDTGVMHLAGAIGKPVWTLLSNSCWRFLRHGETCVWYPTMRLFRNNDKGYDSAVDRVVREMEKLA